MSNRETCASCLWLWSVGTRRLVRCSAQRTNRVCISSGPATKTPSGAETSIKYARMWKSASSVQLHVSYGTALAPCYPTLGSYKRFYKYGVNPTPLLILCLFCFSDSALFLSLLLVCFFIYLCSLFFFFFTPSCR